MKINQIIQEAPFTDEQEKTFISKLDAQAADRYNDYDIDDTVRSVNPDIDYLNSGLYSRVYDSVTSDSVIKIARNDIGSITYMSWCIRNQKNPHVPKIRNMHKTPNGYYLYVRMEKLVDASIKDLKPSDTPAIFYCAARLGKLPYEFIEKYVCPLLISLGVDNLDVEFYEQTYDKIREFNSILSKNPELYNKLKKSWATDQFTQVFRFLDKIKRDEKFFLDFAFHEEGRFHNIMKRPSTGELVVTDPLGGN